VEIAAGAVDDDDCREGHQVEGVERLRTEILVGDHACRCNLLGEQRTEPADRREVDGAEIV
jgi:hypothetical protein